VTGNNHGRCAELCTHNPTATIASTWSVRNRMVQTGQESGRLALLHVSLGRLG
jgi:hypothetical protein